MHPDVHGRGLATEGAQEVLRLGFEQVGLHRIIAVVRCAERRIAARDGAARDAPRGRAPARSSSLKGEWIDEVICAVLEADVAIRPADDGASRRASALHDYASTMYSHEEMTCRPFSEPSSLPPVSGRARR